MPRSRSRSRTLPASLPFPFRPFPPGDSPSILVVGEGNTVAQRPVVVGMRTATLAEIRSGLSEGDLVVVGDRSGLAPGTVVSPKVVETPAAE